MKALFIVGLALALSACSTQKGASKTNVTPETTKQIGDAVTVPLNDLNLIETAIPDALRNAQKNPYAAPADTSCTALAKDITALDEALGADLDTPVVKDNESLVARRVMSESVSAIRKTTEAVVPFRNWVRKLSGAERKSRAVASAIAAGSIRRAYLKGIGHSHKCEAPAAPHTIATKN